MSEIDKWMEEKKFEASIKQLIKTFCVKLTRFAEVRKAYPNGINDIFKDLQITQNGRVFPNQRQAAALLFKEKKNHVWNVYVLVSVVYLLMDMDGLEQGRRTKCDGRDI